MAFLAAWDEVSLSFENITKTRDHASTLLEAGSDLEFKLRDMSAFAFDTEV
jgi:hypothetical protein